ncbi:MAG: CDP-alcohol phosphatidyltransferase family protein [Acidobacteriota bacterium]
MADNLFKTAERIQDSFLAKVEKRALYWLAARMPYRITPDHLTLIGLGALVLCGAFYFASRSGPGWLHLVNLLLVINWFGDSLDGTLARYRNRQRPRYGFYVDHITDAVGTLALLTGLGLSGYMSERVAFALLALYLLLSINSYLWVYAMGKFHLSFWKFSPTELRLLLIVGNLVLLYKPRVILFGRHCLLFDAGGTVAAGLMVLMLASSIIRNTRQLYLLERV